MPKGRRREEPDDGQSKAPDTTGEEAMEAVWPLIECGKPDERAGAALRSVQSLRKACERGGWGCSRAGLRDVHHPTPLSRWISDDLRGNPARISRREGRKKGRQPRQALLPVEINLAG